MTYTAEIGISHRTSLNGMCGVTVTPDSPAPGRGMGNVDTPLTTKDAVSLDREDVIDQAESVPAANGWTVDGDWVDGDDSYYAPVRPA